MLLWSLPTCFWVCKIILFFPFQRRVQRFLWQGKHGGGGVKEYADEGKIMVIFKCKQMVDRKNIEKLKTDCLILYYSSIFLQRNDT